MAEYCIGYLYHTQEYPLVLDGPEEIRITSYTDASLATRPKSRSITGQIIKLIVKHNWMSNRVQYMLKQEQGIKYYYHHSKVYLTPYVVNNHK